MANEQQLIDANEFLNRLSNTVYDTPTDFGYTPGLIKAVLKSTRTMDAVVVEDKELLKAIKMLIKQYEHSKRSDYVHSPVAHALYHTWKQVDERREEE